MEEEEGGKMKGFAEKMSKKLESLETQKKSLRKSISSVVFECKGFEDSLSQTVKELDTERDSLKKKLQLVEEKEKEFKLFSDRGIAKLNKEREDFSKEVEFREAKFQEREKTLEDLLKKLEIQRDEIQGKQENIKQLNKESQEFLKEIEFQKDEMSVSMKEMERRRVEIEGKEEMVLKREKRVEANEKEMELMIERQREVEMKAKELDLMTEDLVFKEKDVGLIGDLNEKRSKELDTREEQLGAKEKDVEKRSKELDMWEKQLGAKERRLETLLDKVEAQLKNVVEKSGGMKKIEEQKELQLLNIETNGKHSKEPPLQKCKELDVSKKTFDDRSKVAESNHKHPNEDVTLDNSSLGKNLQRQLVSEGHHASVEEVAVEGSVGRQSQRQSHEENHVCNQLNMKESHLGGHCLKEKECREPQMNQLNDEHLASVKEAIAAAAEEPKERQLHKQIHEENNNENHLKKKGSHLEKELSVKEKTPSLVGKGIRQEGYELHKFLLDHGKELNKVVDQVIKTIQQSKEPAKLVLTAVEEFYNLVITEKETEEKKDIACRSCILLLDQLMNLSVDSHISSVKDEALKFASVWKANLKIRDSFEVLGFLYFLASYKLANAFPLDAVIRLLEVVAQHQQTRDLCRRLGLKNNRIHVLITELIRKNRILLAFDYVHELELADEFPPVAILKKHLLYSRIEAKKLVNSKKGKMNHEAQDRALSNEISALNDVIRCIMHRSLQAEYPPADLKERIEFLERQRDSLSPEKQKVESYRSGNTQHDNATHQQSKKKQNKRRRRYNRSELLPLSKCRRVVPPPEDLHRSGNSSRYPDPYAPRWQQQQSDPPCHVDNLVSKYLTAGNRDSMYPAHHPFPSVEQPPALQSVFMVPGQPIYPVHPSYIR